MRRFFLTFFYTGLLPKAPGTWGSIAGAIVGYFILSYFGLQTLFLLTILVSLIAIKEIDKDEALSGVHDKSEIVIDEVVGVWLAFTISGATSLQLFFGLIFFRVFDIWKPSMIGRVDKEVKGGLGVVGDDLLAGVFAGIASGMAYMVWEWILSNFI